MAIDWNVLTFGRHAGKSLPQILFSDPDYFYWAVETNIFETRGKVLKEQAALILERSQNVLIPENDNNSRLVEYVITPDYKFARFDIIDVDEPIHTGGSKTIRSETLSFRFPRTLKGYDKSGYTLFLKSFKSWILGSSRVKLTKAISEEFWSDENNFS